MTSVETWRKYGRTIDTPDGHVWACELGPATQSKNETPVVVLHGFPTSSWDFAECALTLARTRRVVLFDFLGFGFSGKPREYGYSLFEQADTVALVLRAFGVSRANVWAHDMGTSIACELLARQERGVLPFEVASFVLMNGSVHIELAELTPSQQLLRTRFASLFVKVSSRFLFAAQMRRICGRPLPDEEIDGMWELMVREDGVARLPQTIAYIDERYRFARRWIGALERTELPALVAWGRRDTVAVPAIADQLLREIRSAKSLFWDDLGHYPQVEDPERVALAMDGFWSALPSQ